MRDYKIDIITWDIF